MLLFSRLIYRVALKGYKLAAFISGFFNQKAKNWAVGQHECWLKIEEVASQFHGAVWVHCASVGEFEQAKPIIERIKKDFPKKRILVSFFSPSGYPVGKKYALADAVVYLPLDSPENARRFVKIIKPCLAVFVKYEFWYFYLQELKSRQIPTFLVSGIFRSGQVFFRWYGGLFREMLGCFNHILLQDESSARLMRSIGLTNVEVAGDTRFDRVLGLANTEFSDQKLETFCSGYKILIAGSTWPKDEDLLVPFFNDAKPVGWKMIIAPHELSESGFQRIEEIANKLTERYSQAIENIESAQILIIDNIGLLSKLYRFGNVAFVGGGFGTGIHNVLEPAVYGLPVVFGPRFGKFKEANDLVEKGGAFSVESYDELRATLGKLIEDETGRKGCSEVAENYVLQNSGATETIMVSLRLHFE